MKKKLIPLLLITIILSSCGIFNNNYSSSENNVSSSEISSTSISSTIDYTCLNVISLDSDSCSTGLFKYSTGSYGDFYNGYRFDFYRAYKKSEELLRLLPYVSSNSVEGLNSAFYNRNKIDGIKKIDITYSIY